MSWVDEIHTHLYGIADRQTECPHTVPRTSRAMVRATSIDECSSHTL